MAGSGQLPISYQDPPRASRLLGTVYAVSKRSMWGIVESCAAICSAQMTVTPEASFRMLSVSNVVQGVCQLLGLGASGEGRALWQGSAPPYVSI